MDSLVNAGIVAIRDPDDAGAAALSTFIVTGVARGGTSMVAQILLRLGVFMGERHDAVVVEDVDILDCLQSRDIGRFNELIANRNAKFSRWGFKLPNLHDYLPCEDLARFRNPRLIVVFRDPLAIAIRNNLSMSRELSAAVREAAADVGRVAAYAFAASAPALLISYEKALLNPEVLVEALSKFCGLSPDEESSLEAITMVEANRPTYIKATRMIIRGCIDEVKSQILRGWCSYQTSPATVTVDVLADHVSLGKFPANEFRGDLVAAGIHQGKHAFNIDLSKFDLPPETIISVCPAGTIFNLRRSGKTLAELRERSADKEAK